MYGSRRPEPDHPWAWFDDLASLAEWDEDVRRERWGQIRRPLPDMVHEAPDGTFLVVEPMVGGLFLAWMRLGYGNAQALLDEWQNAWSTVFVVQFAHLSRTERLQAVQAAELQNVPMVPGVTMMQ